MRCLLALPALLAGGWSAWRRRQGLYDRRTLALRWWAWRLCGSDAALLALALCRRDFGLPLPRRWRARLSTALLHASGRRRQRLEALLAGDGGPAGVAMAALRVRFAIWLAEHRQAGGICVVGNAAGLLGSGLGAQIDAHGVVLRFNQWHGEGNRVQDLGASVQVWVVSPGCHAAPPAGLAWAMVSGPDPAAAMAGWPVVGLLTQAGVPVLTVPLMVWRDLVRRLEAPPSAGVLALAWLRALVDDQDVDTKGGWAGVSSAGIGWGAGPDGAHHLLGPGHRVGRRHRWGRERQLLQQWWEKGLRSLR